MKHGRNLNDIFANKKKKGESFLNLTTYEAHFFKFLTWKENLLSNVKS